MNFPELGRRVGEAVEKRRDLGASSQQNFVRAGDAVIDLCAEAQYVLSFPLPLEAQNVLRKRYTSLTLDAVKAMMKVAESASFQKTLWHIVALNSDLSSTELVEELNAAGLEVDDSAVRKVRNAREKK